MYRVGGTCAHVEVRDQHCEVVLSLYLYGARVCEQAWIPPSGLSTPALAACAVLLVPAKWDLTGTVAATSQLGVSLYHVCFLPIFLFLLAIGKLTLSLPAFKA